MDYLKLDNILQVYKQQHYFIDRHEIMAEKLLTVILVLTTIISAIVTFNFNDIRNIYLVVPFCFYIICFLITVLQIMATIQPLSSKAIKTSTSIVEKFNKNWPEESVIYYRGIIKIKDVALSENRPPLDKYKELLSENYEEDLLKQIFILAQYSNYKRKRLEGAKKASTITVAMGGVCIIMYIICSVFG